MIRKGKSLLFGHISHNFKKNGGSTAAAAEFSGHIRLIFDDTDQCTYTENWGNDGGTAVIAEKRRLPPMFLPFLAELDNSESFETNFFFKKKFP